jgi:hypothetical protein
LLKNREDLESWFAYENQTASFFFAWDCVVDI